MVVLEDYIHEPPRDGIETPPSIENCRWFTRGWTLQELLANDDLLFYDADWKCFASKQKIYKQLSEITGIDEGVIQGAVHVWYRPVACRLSWASRRSTSRVEDEVYCLLGLLQVNMPLLYGEQHMAFRRLQHEILRNHDDPSLFLWTIWDDHWASRGPILADNVRAFRYCSSLRYTFLDKNIYNSSFLPTTRGIRVTRPKLMIRKSPTDIDGNAYVMPLLGVYNDESTTNPDRRLSATYKEEDTDDPSPGLTLFKMRSGTYSRQPMRLSGIDVVGDCVSDLAVPEEEIYILDHVEDFDNSFVRIRCLAPLQPLSETPYYAAQPRAAWDSANSRFLLDRELRVAAYIKIYPRVRHTPMHPADMCFFIVTFSRMPLESGVRVQLVAQDIWTMLESLRRDEAWLVDQAALHPATATVNLDKGDAHIVGGFVILAELKCHVDEDTSEWLQHAYTLNLSLAE